MPQLPTGREHVHPDWLNELELAAQPVFDHLERGRNTAESRLTLTALTDPEDTPSREKVRSALVYLVFGRKVVGVEKASGQFRYYSLGLPVSGDPGLTDSDAAAVGNGAPMLPKGQG